VNIPQDFYLGTYHVTQEEWQEIMGKNPSHFTRDKVGKEVSDEDLKRFPVESVSWEEANDFVKRVNEKLKNDPRESGWEYRLPTEEQWEYACRNGPMIDKADSKFDYYFKKPSGELSEKTANCIGIHNERLNRPTRVGSYPANKLGLYDMHGNVWEWCEDQFGAKGGPMRAIRGGSWDDEGGFCRAVDRRGCLPAYGGGSLGLRLARVPVNAEPKPSH
jgi:eukaryotic-like serine/threonine-protein kinase